MEYTESQEVYKTLHCFLKNIIAQENNLASVGCDKFPLWLPILAFIRNYFGHPVAPLNGLTPKDFRGTPKDDLCQQFGVPFKVANRPSVLSS